ncbi:ATP-binding protein [Paenibacillus sp. TRM 82003]|uniref:sensor histidine kinase n=1 Tax=Kineococcus sp. TRM81007 TaxID=2925831 RepID=UPI001F5A76FA|nr:ATP-binding protein [Kineococcus sp. TRM81007]MCI2239749.1 ATP-binding protein [Kineococcus sp. TRM81007]MCI3926689.1 ATP-binding protein [Paenibacillus sp. TRM 82003]
MAEPRGTTGAAAATAPGPACPPQPAPLLDGAAPVPLDELPDGVVLVGADGRITAVNAAAATLLGRTAGELVGSDVRRALPLQDTSGRRWWDVADTALDAAGGHPERMLLLPGGRELLVTARYVRSGGGAVQRAVVALRGTDQRRRAESDAAALIATVAHELRSPLTSVKQFTASLLRRWDRFTDEQKRLMLSTVQADADRVTRLVGDLLDVSRVDTGRLHVHRRPVDLPALVREHVERLRVAGYEDDRFELDLAAGLPELWADPDRLAQVVTNLVENAVRHGAGTVSITLGHEAVAGGGPGEVVLTVDDEGEGVPVENRPYVFSKFWHGGSRSGTGLGLYVTRGLVEAHGGEVAVSSSPAGGARFRVRLPAGEPPAPRP